MAQRVICAVAASLALGGVAWAAPLLLTPPASPDALSTTDRASVPGQPALDPAQLALARQIIAVVFSDDRAESLIDEHTRGASPHPLRFFKQSAHGDVRVEALFRENEADGIRDYRAILIDMIPVTREAMARACSRAYTHGQLAKALIKAQATAEFVYQWPDARIREDPDMLAYFHQLRARVNAKMQQRKSLLLAKIKAYRDAHPDLPGSAGRAD